MKNQFRLWQWPEGSMHGQERDLYDDPAQAAVAAGVPNLDEWRLSADDRGWHLPLPDGDRTGRYQSWAISRTRVPETNEDRIELAIETALSFGQTDGDHHKMWVIDQMVRVLAGDRYEEVITEYCDGEEGPETYSWGEGIAP